MGDLPRQIIAFLGLGDQLWLMGPNGQDREQLTSGGPVQSFAWSPDGEKLGYIQEVKPRRHEAMLYELAAKHSYTVTTGIPDDGFYETLSQLSWSPGGRYLLLDSGTSTQRNLVIVEVATGQTKDIVTAGSFDKIYGWSPDGERLGYIQEVEPGRREVVLYEVATGHSYTATADISEDWLFETFSIPVGWFHETLTGFSWSPGGRYLLLDSGTSMQRNLVIIEVATGQIKNGLNAIGYAWSPDGQRLAFGQTHPLETPIPIESGASIDIAVLEVGQQIPRVLLEGTSEVLYYPRVWLPDDRLLYSRWAWKEAGTDSYSSEWTLMVDVGNEEPRPAQDIPPDYDPDLRAGFPIEFRGLANASHFSWSNDQRWVVFQAGGPPNAGIYLLLWQSSEPPRRLADGTGPAWQPLPNP